MDVLALSFVKFERKRNYRVTKWVLFFAQFTQFASPPLLFPPFAFLEVVKLPPFSPSILSLSFFNVPYLPFKICLLPEESRMHDLLFIFLPA